MMDRVENWRTLLHEAIQSRQNIPFSYGIHDCCLSVCNCIYEITGIDVAKDFRGYRTEEEAEKVLESYGGIEGLVEYIAEKFKIKKVSTSRAGAGDVIVFENLDGRKMLAIIGNDGQFAYAASRNGGWLRVSKKRAVSAWQI